MDVPLVSSHPFDLSPLGLVTVNEASADPMKAAGMFVTDDGATLNLAYISGREKGSTVNPSSELLEMFTKSNAVSISIGFVAVLVLVMGVLIVLCPGNIFGMDDKEWFTTWKL